jgi:hypothetical protein
MSRVFSVVASSAIAATIVASASFQTVQGQQGQVAMVGTVNMLWGDPVAGSNAEPVTRATFTDAAGETRTITFEPGVLEAAGGLRALSRKEVSITAREPDAAAPDADTAPLVVTGVSLRSSADRMIADEHAITGPQPWVTIGCRFSDSPGVTPRPISYFNELMGTTLPGMDHYWREVSYDLINLTGSQSVGWYNLPQPRSFYITIQGGQEVANLNQLALDCTAAADADVNFPTFIGINMAFNQNLDCCAWGGGTTLNRDGQNRFYRITWLPPWAQVSGVFAHEMGHGFGFPHSSGPYSTPYDSNWDPMSNAHNNKITTAYGPRPVHTITHHKDLAEWIPLARKFTATNGTHNITLERTAQPTAAGTYLMAKIPIGGSLTNFYTVETRRLIGYDQAIPDEAVIIHRVNTALGDRDAQVVDATNNSNPNDEGAMWRAGETFSDATNQISVTVNSGAGSLFNITIQVGPVLGPRMAIGSPTAGSTGPMPIFMSGWAIDQSAMSGTGVDMIHVHAFPTGGGASTFIGVATYGQARPDVGSLFGAQFTNSGWSIMVRGLAPGSYTLQAYARSTVTGTFNQTQGVTNVTLQANATLSIDIPGTGSTQLQPFAIGGWAADFAAGVGTGISDIHVWGFPTAGGSPVMFGAATYGAARPDVGSIFGAQFTNSGYGLSVNGVAPGTYVVNVYGRSTVTGTFSVVRSVTLTLESPEFMALDQPFTGTTVNQPMIFSGWAFDRRAATGTGVGDIHIWAYRNPGSGIPPIFIGQAPYGSSRPDVGAIYGAQFTNSGYSLTVSGVPPGNYLFVVYAYSTATGTFNQYRATHINVN